MDRFKLFLIQWGETAMAVTLAVCIALMFLLSCLGCASTEPRVIIQPVEVPGAPAPMRGTELPVCRTNIQPCAGTAADKVRCIGNNIVELERCDKLNTMTLDSHNKAVTEEPPPE